MVADVRDGPEGAVALLGELDVGAQVDDVADAEAGHERLDRLGREVLEVVGAQQPPRPHRLTGLRRQAAEVAHVGDAVEVDPLGAIHHSSLSERPSTVCIARGGRPQRQTRPTVTARMLIEMKGGPSGRVSSPPPAAMWSTTSCPSTHAPEHRVDRATAGHREVAVHHEELARRARDVVSARHADRAPHVAVAGRPVLEGEVVAGVAQAAPRRVAALEEARRRLPGRQPVADAVGPVAGAGQRHERGHGGRGRATVELEGDDATRRGQDGAPATAGRRRVGRRPEPRRRCRGRGWRAAGDLRSAARLGAARPGRHHDQPDRGDDDRDHEQQGGAHRRHRRWGLGVARTAHAASVGRRPVSGAVLA